MDKLLDRPDKPIDRKIQILEGKIIGQVVGSLKHDMDWGDFLEAATLMLGSDNEHVAAIKPLLQERYGV